MLRGVSATILEWAVHESPWVFENPKLSELFQNCLFHFFVDHSKKTGIFAECLNLSKNLSQGFYEFSRDCDASLKVLQYSARFKTEIHPKRLAALKASPEALDFMQEFPFFFQQKDNLRQAAV